MARAIQIKNIKPSKRICSNCHKEIRGRGYWYILSTSRGKYLCHFCEREYESNKIAIN